MIPNVFHYIWVGGKPLPDSVKINIETWKDTNPGFAIVQWDESNIDFSSAFIRRSYRLGYWARVADYARLDILKKHGGIYLDTDVKVIKKFDFLLGQKLFLGFEDDNGTINNAVIGARCGHWFLDLALDRVNSSKTGLEKMDSSVGPGLLTSLIKESNLLKDSEIGATCGDIFIAPKRYFYPYSWNEQFYEECIKEETVSIHLWEKTWHNGKDSSTPTEKLQNIIQNYPSLLKKDWVVSAIENAMFLTETMAGKGKFMRRRMPWVI